jgi:hypothetical protein
MYGSHEQSEANPAQPRERLENAAAGKLLAVFSLDLDR